MQRRWRARATTTAAWCTTIIGGAQQQAVRAKEVGALQRCVVAAQHGSEHGLLRWAAGCRS
jgi:hypothetical protein